MGQPSATICKDLHTQPRSKKTAPLFKSLLEKMQSLIPAGCGLVFTILLLRNV